MYILCKIYKYFWQRKKIERGSICLLNKDKIVKAEVYNKAGKLIVSTVSPEFPKDFFSLKGTDFVVIKDKRVAPAQIGEPVDVIFYYINGTRIKYETVIDLATDMQVNIHVGPEYTIMEERRRFFKVEVDAAGLVKSFVRDGKETLFDEPLTVRIKNINLGGVFMVSNFEFIVGDTFTLSLPSCGVEVSTEVLRVQKDAEGIVAGYGCKFLDLSFSGEEKISRFVFECQKKDKEKLKTKSAKGF